VPAAVLTEVYRAPDQVNLARLLKGCQVEPLVLDNAKAAGVLLGRCPMDVGAVDASCVEGALRRGDAVVTANHTHLLALADGVGRKLDIVPV
jgi:hypothetical protein